MLAEEEDIEYSQEDLLNKLAFLENKTKAQDMEVHLLKTAFSDVISRLSMLENDVKNVKIAKNERKDVPLSEPITPTKRSVDLWQKKTRPRPKSMIISSNGTFSPTVPNKTSGPTTPVSKTPGPTTPVSKTAGTAYGTSNGAKKTKASSERRLSNSTKKTAILTKRGSSQDISPPTSPANVKTEDGKPKLILAKKPSFSKRPKSLSSSQSSDEISPKEDLIKFYMRGRSITMYTPSDHNERKYDNTAPDEKLQLAWVYGYRGKDCRDNMFKLASGELMYNMAGVVIMYDEKTETQRHYTEHTEAVKCICLHPNQELIASGQVAGHGDGDDGKPHVLVWNSTTLETISSFGHGHFERALCAVGFSPTENGRYLAAIDESNDHCISVWDWEKKIKLAETKCSKELIFGINWNPISTLSFVTYGKSHLGFWEFNSDPKNCQLTKKMGIYEKIDKPKYVLTTAFTSIGDVVTGDTNGNILLFKNGSNRVAKASKPSQKGGIFSVCVLPDDTVVSGGKDGQFSLWDNDLIKLKDLSQLDDCYGPARCIVYDKIQESFVVGTARNCILSYPSDMSKETIISQGHSDEMWGLATHPTETIFVTCSQEQLVCIWDSKTQENLWTYPIDDSAQCCCFHPTKPFVLVATTNGTICVLNYDTKEELVTLPVAMEMLDDIKFSPDGTSFATACRDMNIYLYQWPNDISNFKKPKVLQGHSSRVLHLDWSRDCEYLQSNSSDYEVLYWHAESGCQILSSAALRDVEWETWTCPFGFPVMGIWPEGADGTDINTCSRSTNFKLVATGDDFGEVKLFRFPSVKLKSENHVGVGHSSHVTNVRFLSNDAGLITVGGKDCSVMQWKLMPATTE